MATAKKLKSNKMNNLKAQIMKEINFLGNVFTSLSLPRTFIEDSNDILYDSDKANENEAAPEVVIKRAKTITELEERLEKMKTIKAQNKHNLKQRLLKKSLSSKLNKKIKKQQRSNPTKVKPDETCDVEDKKVELLVPSTPHVAKPIFNTEGKLVFSKFDFAENTHINKKTHKIVKDPKKILENLSKQEEKLKQLEQQNNPEKAKEIREKTSWKNVLQKAEGQKVKDDKLLLKKSIKKQEQKKKKSKKEWSSRIEGVERKKEEKQKKRKDNIVKKKKEKKSKIVKASVKRGRVVL